MTSILGGASERRPFAGEGGRTGASFERAVLADGTPVVIKHITPGDWLIAAAGGDSHMYRLWKAGVFDRVPASIDHAMLAIEECDDGWIAVMRDVSDAVLAEGRVLSREENRRVLEAADALHAEFWGDSLPGVSLYDHYALFTPKRLDGIGALNSPIPDLMRRGWDLFSDVAPPDVVDVMAGVRDEPAALVAELAKSPQTLIHGDLRLHNMGLDRDSVVLFDWEVAGNAPPAVEFAWYLIISASRIDATREQVIDDYKRVAGERFDGHAWDLACIGAMLWLGWNKAIDIIENPDPAIRAQERADLDWWIVRVREALEAWPGR